MIYFNEEISVTFMFEKLNGKGQFMHSYILNTWTIVHVSIVLEKLTHAFKRSTGLPFRESRIRTPTDTW